MIPKQPRVKDKRVTDKIRAIGHCEICGRMDLALHVHHIHSRGAGGADEDGNLVCLCCLCHDRAHRWRIPRELLTRVAERRSKHGRSAAGVAGADH